MNTSLNEESIMQHELDHVYSLWKNVNLASIQVLERNIIPPKHFMLTFTFND